MPADPTTPKAPHRLMVALPAPLADLLRETASITKYTQAGLLTAISESRAFANAAETVLQQKYMERLKQGERLFARTRKDPAPPTPQQDPESP